MDFDQFIIDFPLHQAEKLKNHCSRHKLTVALNHAEQIIQFLSGIKEHGSTKISYQTIYNQCVVLLVSFFTAALEDIFEYCIFSAIINTTPKWLGKELTIDIHDFCQIEGDPSKRVGELLIKNNDISFQDMKSIKRTFHDYFDIDISKDENMLNIIFGQASRHLIVHSSGRIDNRFKAQITSTVGRTIMKELPDEGIIRFEKQEIKKLGQNMQNFIVSLIGSLAKHQLLEK